jgi:predicted ester cyclase
MGNPTKGLDAIKKEMGQMSQMSKDMNYEVVKELADSEYVFSWMHFTGTNIVANMGMPAGSKYDMHTIEVGRFKDGKAVEHWSFGDMAEMMKMMPPPAMPMPVDSSKVK